MNSRNKKSFGSALLLAMALPLAPLSVVEALPWAPALTASAPAAEQMNTTTVMLTLANKQQMYIDFYGDNIFRVFIDPAGGMLRDPQADPETRILVLNPRRAAKVAVSGNVITTSRVRLTVNEQTGQISVTDLKTGRTVIDMTAAPVIEKNHTEIALKEQSGEYFYGGGVQNGRFSHKGKEIKILNSNNWVDKGVASPCPFYWSTGGYGMMAYTFQPGVYDFGAKTKGTVRLVHESDYLDLFFMVDETPAALLGDYYQLTGNPVLLPKFGFYEGHLNAYNRDYWKQTEKPADGKFLLFEDGKYYSESQKDNGGTKESLNGEKQNYQFSARAVVDRYAAHDMPLGWVLPNDGYGAGYGQTNSLEGNIQNLKEFGDYARSKGVEIGLWTQSNLHPKAGVQPLLQRDIVGEVRDAGVRVLKTDVAWVGAGYSFGLHGIADVAQIMPFYGHDARPFIISLDGWAGTQRYAGVWTGDQTGGEWEYIRFHIPTYIGSGLAGMPNVTSDMDGIFGGGNVPVNVRDFEWKTFTPMQLNMDGWGKNAKYPHILGEPAASINRNYLKFKSALLPYTYSIAHEAVTGKPIMRAMFLDFPNDYTHGKATEYQYMYGPYFLIAPIYQETKMDKDGNDIRNGIYLPEGTWIDYFSGETYQGGRIINTFDAPLWKLPVFVKAGAIIPLTNPNNHVSEIKKDLRIYELYPAGETSFTQYDDDGTTVDYALGQSSTTELSLRADKGTATFTIAPEQGTFNGQVKQKVTEVRFNVTAKPKKVTAKVGKQKVSLTEANTLEAFRNGTNVYFYDAAPNLNQFSTKGGGIENDIVQKNPQMLVRLAATDVTAATTVITLTGYVYAPADPLLKQTGSLTAPLALVKEEDRKPYSLTPSWEKVSGADYYEIQYDGMNYSTIRDTQFPFDGLTPETDYSFQVRAVNRDGASAWTTVKAQTKTNPLEFAIKGIKASTSCSNQGGQNINKLFDFDESSAWHTKWDGKAVPFTMDLDLRGISTLSKIQYLPRTDAGNGTIQEGTYSLSTDKVTWTTPVPFSWTADGKMKEITFPDKTQAEFIRFSITKAKGDFGSGQEMYVFKVPGTETILPGDINHDGKIDMDDFTSYMNYTGLRKGDSDFDGYISGGDINHNGLIDAYDISVVGTQVRGGADTYGMKPLAGTFTLVPDKPSYQAGDDVLITVKGAGMDAINAISFALPYSTAELEYAGIQLLGMKDMENLTNDRLHSNGQKALYPTFVNTGDKDVLEGNADLFVLKFKAKKALKFHLKPVDGLMVDKALNVKNF